MAEIRPLRAWRYADSLYKKIDEITSPLFDVVSEKQRQKLYQNPYSSIHLSVPQDSAHSARQVLEKWKTDGTIIQDPLPGIYVYYQYFSLPGSVDEICRKGFMCNIRLTEWHEKVVLHHENTMSQAVEERTDVIKKTELNVSPTHGLYTDIDFELEKYMDDSMKNPVYETEDYQGVRDVLSIIHDYKIIQKFITKLKDKTIILADGHHRYQGSLDYMHLAKSNNPQHNGQEGYNFHLMYLTNTESDNLRILPTHRLVNNLANFNENEIIEKLGKYFTIKPIEDTFYLNEIICGKKYAFGLIFKSQAYKVRLKPEYYNGVTWPFPDVIKQLDLTVMHYFIIEKALGIPGPKQRNTKNILFDRSFSDCYARVLKNEVQMAIIVNELTIDEVKKVCASGYTLPQKSTYFYPKVVSGFLYSSIKADEFKFPDNLSFELSEEESFTEGHRA